MSMTPAEMREMAAKVCDEWSDADVECLNQAPDDIRQHYHSGGRDASAMCARSIRTLPIPDTTAADEALETAREAALREAAAVAGTMAEGPYNDDPEFSAMIHVEQAILDLIAKPPNRTVIKSVDEVLLQKAREALKPFARMGHLLNGYLANKYPEPPLNEYGQHFRFAAKALAAIDAAKAKGGG